MVHHQEAIGYPSTPGRVVVNYVEAPNEASDAPTPSSIFDQPSEETLKLFRAAFDDAFNWCFERDRETTAADVLYMAEVRLEAVLDAAWEAAETGRYRETSALVDALETEPGRAAGARLAKRMVESWGRA